MVNQNKEYYLGLYEKSMPNTLSWEEKLKVVKEAGFDYLEMSIDETEEKLARLDQSVDEIEKAIEKTGVPINSTDVDKYASTSKFTLIPDATKLRGYDVAVKISISNITIDTALKISDFKYDLKCNDGSSTTTIKSGTGADFTSTELEIGTLSTQNSTFNVSKTYNCALRLWLQETGSNQNALMNKSFSGLIKVNSVYRK